MECHGGNTLAELRAPILPLPCEGHRLQATTTSARKHCDNQADLELRRGSHKGPVSLDIVEDIRRETGAMTAERKQRTTDYYRQLALRAGESTIDLHGKSGTAGGFLGIRVMLENPD